MTWIYESRLILRGCDDFFFLFVTGTNGAVLSETRLSGLNTVDDLFYLKKKTKFVKSNVNVLYEFL